MEQTLSGYIQPPAKCPKVMKALAQYTLSIAARDERVWQAYMMQVYNDDITI